MEAQEFVDLTGKDLFMITAQPEEGADKMTAIECWSISSEFTQQVKVYRNSVVSQRTLDFIGDSYLAGGAAKKPWISVWPLNQLTPVQPPLLVPTTLTSLAVSPDGETLLIAINNKLSVYDLTTGDFVAYLTRHYGVIACLAFSLCGRHFASAGQDGTLFVWKTAEVLSSGASSNPQTVTCQGRIEDLIFAGADSSYSFLVTVAADHACRVYDSSAVGQGPMGNFVFRRPLIAVAADLAVTNLAISDDAGSIFRLPLITPDSRSSHPHMMSESDWNQRFQFSGHTKTVRCLQFSGDGSLLVSGSDDLTVRVWQVKNRVCVRKLTFRGPVTNLIRCRYPESVSSKRNFMTSRPLPALKKQLASDSLNSGEKYTDIRLPALALAYALPPTQKDTGLVTAPSMPQGGDTKELDELRKLSASLAAQLRDQEHQVATLKNVNRELYDLAREKMLELRKS